MPHEREPGGGADSRALERALCANTPCNVQTVSRGLTVYSGAQEQSVGSRAPHNPPFFSSRKYPHLPDLVQGASTIIACRLGRRTAQPAKVVFTASASGPQLPPSRSQRVVGCRDHGEASARTLPSERSALSRRSPQALRPLANRHPHPPFGVGCSSRCARRASRCGRAQPLG